MRNGRVWPGEGCSRVPNWVYTDPEIFARENERIFGANDWLYVCLEAEIPNPGDFQRSQLGTREVVAVRGRDGEINVLLNSCAHRGMNSARPIMVPRKNSSAPIINGRTTLRATCSACRSAAAIAARGACKPIFPPRRMGCSGLR
jgi:nitrite reductase/ring-hydroxylating ferredoxin subunit